MAGLLRGASSEGSVRAWDLFVRGMRMGSPVRPIRKMAMAELWSRSSSVPHEQECHRSSSVFGLMAPQPLQIWLVYLGETSSTREPASSALFSQCCTNCAHPASRILLFRPAFAAAPLGLS